MFERVLIANRGEIACRIITTLREMGIASIAVYSDADAGAKHVCLADEAVRIGPAPTAQSYLNIDNIIDAARSSGAQAIHPGYGFLAENPALARACAAAGIRFIGPSTEALEIMGDKIRAKAHAAGRGVPTVPGVSERGLSDDELIARSGEAGFPLLIKPSAGGGGKGMHVVNYAEDLSEALERARREAVSAFGDGELLLERLITTPRHIEVQVLADGNGHTIHLGERECSLQRRHQKIIEEAPSPLLDAATRERIGVAAIEVARSIDYEGAGTVEFIVDAARPDEFFFMEMNTRLQVEHPVTEMVTGIDLVRWQVLIAAGEPLRLPSVTFTGHAIEARIYAENPAAGFLPTGGQVRQLTEARGPGIRVDSALMEGLSVSPDYDPMLAKVIAHGRTRSEAIGLLDRALADTSIIGVGTNVEFLRHLLADPDVRAGNLDTGLVDRFEFDSVEPGAHALGTAALVRTGVGAEVGPGPKAWQRRDGWRIGGSALLRAEFEGYPAVEVARGAELSLGEGTASAVIDGVRRHYTYARENDTVFLSRGGAVWEFAPVAADESGTLPGASSPQLIAPMPGTVVAVHAHTGDHVEEGAAVVVIEAMKMEHVLRAPHAGEAAVAVEVGEQVQAKQVLATIKESGDE